MSRASYYRLKASACEKISEDQNVIWEIRAQYRELAQAWNDCAREAEWIEEQAHKNRA